MCETFVAGGLDSIRNTDLAAVNRELAAARALPGNTEEEKAARTFDIEFCKKRIAAKKAFDKFYGEKAPFEEPNMEKLTALFDKEDAIDALLFDAVQTQNTARKAKQTTQINMQKETIRRLQAEKKQIQKQQKALMDAFARFNRAAKPYNDARRLLRQRENYSRFDEIAAMYETAKANTVQSEAEAPES